MAERLSVEPFVPIRRAQIFTGNANPELALEVAEHLDTELSPRELRPFSDGEIKCRLEDSVRGNYVFVIQSHGGGGMDPNIALMEQLLLCGTAKGASAAKVIAICPYLGYSRQDRKSAGREPISAEIVCNALGSAGADGIVSIDLHASQIQGFFGGKPFDNLTAAPVLRRAIEPQLEEGVVVVSPDSGRIKIAEGHRKRMPSLNAGTAYIDKRRSKDNVDEVEALEVIGDAIKGRQCLAIDDMIATGGSLDAAAVALMDRGAKEVLAIATHPVLSGDAVATLGGSAIKQIVAANTRALTDEQKSIDKLKIASVAQLIAHAIYEIFRDGSISNLFDEGEHHR